MSAMWLRCSPQDGLLERRLEGTRSGLEELDYLRRRQELLVRRALRGAGERGLAEPRGDTEYRGDTEPRGEGDPSRGPRESDPSRGEWGPSRGDVDPSRGEGDPSRGEGGPSRGEGGPSQWNRSLSLEEKVVEEKLLLLRKQLNLLRTRDAGLVTQLQNLDRQISELRLDAGSHDQNDSRPSSGFYELSDGVSGSLSNSSNSVFSECFCDGRIPSTDELSHSLGCDDLLVGLCEDSCGAVPRSVSAPQASLDPPPRLGGVELYRYPSPLHAVAFQSSALLQALGPGPPRDRAAPDQDGPAGGSAEGQSADLHPPVAPPPVPQSSSSSSQKRLDSYIYALLQRRVQPVRWSRPRTTVTADPAKNVLRQAGLSMRQAPVVRQTPVTSSPQRQWSVESRGAEQVKDLAPNQNGRSVRHGSCSNNINSLLLPSTASVATLPQNYEELGSPKANSSPKERRRQPSCPANAARSIRPKPHPSGRNGRRDWTVPELVGPGSSAQPQDGGGAGHKVEVVGERRNGGSKRVKVARVKSSSTMRAGRSSEDVQLPAGTGQPQHHHRSTSSRSRFTEDLNSTHLKVSKRTPGGAFRPSSSRNKTVPASVPEGRVLDKHTQATSRASRSRHHHHSYSHHHHQHHHHHGRDHVAVVAKPKYKRSDYPRLRAEPPYEEALRRAQRRQRRGRLARMTANMHPPSGGQHSSPARAAVSDSEYSAECASLFHSTIMDTSEDDRSNYTANRFGDTESSEDAAEESTGAGDSENRACRGQTQAVKVKASHNLKKKILRFRSGSLKLMTTV